MTNLITPTSAKVYLFGFSRWKHGFIKAFLQEYLLNNIFFINPLFSSELELARKKGIDKDSHIMIWGKKVFPEVEEFAALHAMKIIRVEDGFIRSVGLGSDLTQPYSLVIDTNGIYFDPATPSDLEQIIDSYDFDQDTKLLERAEALMQKIIETKISKYNADAHKNISFPTTKRVVLVPGQVEDDASVRLGTNGMSNLSLLQKVRENLPDAYIVFKPHPDVLSGNRIGSVSLDSALEFCNEIVSDISMASLLEVVDEVHTMTSLTGFEALIYAKKVVTYGMPFYAGWGLTEDMLSIARRNKRVTLQALVAATLLLYPRYLHPIRLELCEVEEILTYLQEQKIALEKSFYLRFMFTIRNYCSRLGQKLLSLVA